VEHQKEAAAIQIRQFFCTGYVHRAWVGQISRAWVGQINFLARSHTGIGMVDIVSFANSLVIVRTETIR